MHEDSLLGTGFYDGKGAFANILKDNQIKHIIEQLTAFQAGKRFSHCCSNTSLVLFVVVNQ